MPSPEFILAQEIPIPTITVPPIATEPVTSPITIPTTFTQPNDFAWMAVAIVIVCVILFTAWYYFDKRKRIQLEDIRPTTANLSSEDISLNKAAFMQMLPYIPPLIGLSPVLMLAETNGTLALAILIGLVSLPALMYFYMKTKALEDNKGKVNMAGKARSISGDREDYFWRNVEFRTEKHLTDEELVLIDEAKVQFKKVVSKAIDDREKGRKDADLPLENKQDVWTRKNIDAVHAIPIRINNTHDVYLMSVHLETEWEYVKGEDYDYYGYHEVKTTGPELRHIATMHRVIELESEEYRDEYVPVFLVMYDDKMSKDALGAIAPIDITRDHAVSGICKAIGAEERTTAGELNSITEQVMVLENEGKDLDDLSQTIGRKKALDFLMAEKRLTMFNVGMLGTVSTIVAVVFSVVMFFLGYSIGGG